ncbi:MAG: phosphoadenosine phosphosulfate reductase, partial [Pseudomonadota bacterium]
MWYQSLLTLPADSRQMVLAEMNDWLASRAPEARVEWALGNLPEVQVVSSSFGVQAAVMLHMLSHAKP